MGRFASLSLFTAAVLLLANQSLALGSETVKSKTSIASLKSIKPLEDLSYIDEVDKLFDQAQEKYQTGNRAEAKNLFLKILSITPDNLDANFNLGAICEWEGNFKDAQRYYGKAHELKPDDAEITKAWQSVTKYQANSANQNKSEEFNRICAEAKEAFAAKKYYQAIAHLNKLARQYPGDAKVYFALAQSLRAVNNFDWAVYCLKMAIYLDPNIDLYQKTLHDLESEVKKIQEKAFVDTAQTAAAKVRPFAFSEATANGL